MTNEEHVKLERRATLRNDEGYSYEFRFLLLLFFSLFYVCASHHNTIKLDHKWPMKCIGKLERRATFRNEEGYSSENMQNECLHFVSCFFCSFSLFSCVLVTSQHQKTLLDLGVTRLGLTKHDQWSVLEKLERRAALSNWRGVFLRICKISASIFVSCFFFFFFFVLTRTHHITTPENLSWLNLTLPDLTNEVY